MFLAINKSVRTLLLITVVFTATFLMPQPSSATAVCVCYFDDVNDCEPTAVSDAAMEGECKKACEDVRGSGLKSYKYGSTAALSGTIIAECSAAHSAATKEEPVQAIIPKLSVDIPGVTFSPIKKIGGELHVNFLQDYIGGVYKYLLTFSTLAAIVLVIVAGFQYVIGAVSQPQIASAKKRILNAVTGLILLLSVAMILETVNPQLLKFGALRVQYVTGKDFKAGQDVHDKAEEEASGGSGSGNKASASALDCTSYPPKVNGLSGIYVCGKDCAAQLPDAKKSKAVKSSLPIDTTTYLGIMDCFHANERKLSSITTIAVHEGEAGSGSLATWMKKYAKYNIIDKKTGGTKVSTPSSTPVSSHYFIAESGKIIQVTDERFVTYHGVKSATSIGIDMDPVGCSSASLANTENCHYTDAQYQSLKALIKDIQTRTNVKFDDAHILGHCEVNIASKKNAHVDPRGFDFGKIGLNHLAHKVGKCKFIGTPTSADWGVMPTAPPK